MGLGAVVVVIAVGAFLVWVAYLVNSGRTPTDRPEETPKNLQPYLSDDALESNRLTRVLGAAVVAAAVLAVTLPIYYLNEPGRQESAAEGLDELAVEDGAHWYEFFACITCHGPAGSGGGGTYIEKRSGLTTSWAAPSLNDVFYRYSEDEVRFWIVYGRSGTPMPAAGLEGGGAMTDQEIDQTIAYLKSVQVPQSEVLTRSAGAAERALERIDTAAANVAALIEEQLQVIATIQAAPAKFVATGDIPEKVEALLAGPGTCTARSAASLDGTCSDPGADTDRDGVSDAAEAEITDLSALAVEVLGADDAELAAKLDITLDAATAFTGSTAAGEPVPDLQAADAFLREMRTIEINLQVTAERQEVFLATAQQGLDFLDESATAARWEIDFEAIAGEPAFGGDADLARRAGSLYNAYCARCHTAGYSAGPAYEQGAGSGAWAPALWDDRTVVQFPDRQDHIDFIINGSELGKTYGVNGLGRGWMPGFGQSLTLEEIELIVDFERAL